MKVEQATRSTDAPIRRRNLLRLAVGGGVVLFAVSACRDPFGLRDTASIDARLRGLGVAELRPSPPLPEQAGPLELDLTTTVRFALDRNPAIRAARDGLASARFGLDAAWVPFELSIQPSGSVGTVTSLGQTAGELEVGASLSQRFFTGTQVTLNPSYAIATDGQSQSALFGTSISQPLLRGASRTAIRAGIDSAESSLESAARQYRLAEERVVVDAVAAHYAVLRAEQALQFQRASFRRVEGFVKATEVKERIGLADAIDLFRARLRLDQAVDSVQGAEKTRADAMESLRSVLDLSPNHPIDPIGRIRRLSWSIDEDQAVRIALSRRLEIDQAEASIRDARRGVALAEEALLPRLDLVLSYNRLSSGGSFTDALGFDQESLTIGLQTQGDFSPEAQRLALAQSKLSFDAVVRGAAQVRLGVENQVRSTIRRLQRAEERIENQRNQLRQAEGKLRLSQLKFERGLVGNFDLLESETELLSAELGVADAVVDQILAVYELRRSMATLIGEGDPAAPPVAEEEDAASTRSPAASPAPLAAAASAAGVGR
jgi:outer membrane protein TolC